MAQRINVVAHASGNLVEARIRWNDGNGNMVAFEGDNQTDKEAKIYADLDPPINGFSRLEVRIPAFGSVQGSLPNNTASYEKDIDPDTGEVNWHLPPGIQIHCQWPAAPAT